MSKQQEFINKYGPAVIAACSGTTLFPSVKMAQFILESGWGRHTPGNNAFGIKANGKYTPYWKGAAINADTTEYVAGQYEKDNLAFRKYNSVEESIKDHTAMLLAASRYANAGVFKAQTPEEQAELLMVAGYSTEPGYSMTLISLINGYNLKSLDQKKK
jgi:flagellum-specific peptidoglycan hydrolase FlgJ